MTDKEIIQYRDFACNCRPENKEKLKAAREELKRKLSTPNWEVTDGNLLGQIIYRIAGKGASVVETLCDPGGWCALSATVRTYKSNGPDEESEWEDFAHAYIECDWIEDGFVMLYNWVDQLEVPFEADIDE